MSHREKNNTIEKTRHLHLKFIKTEEEAKLPTPLLSNKGTRYSKLTSFWRVFHYWIPPLSTPLSSSPFSALKVQTSQVYRTDKLKRRRCPNKKSRSWKWRKVFPGLIGAAGIYSRTERNKGKIGNDFSRVGFFLPYRKKVFLAKNSSGRPLCHFDRHL